MFNTDSLIFKLKFIKSATFAKYEEEKTGPYGINHGLFRQLQAVKTVEGCQESCRESKQSQSVGPTVSQSISQTVKQSCYLSDKN